MGSPTANVASNTTVEAYMTCTKAKIQRRYNDADAKLTSHIHDLRMIANNMTTMVQTAAFIAGVQATTLTWTINPNDELYNVAVNWFGFSGLMLDVSGGALGMFVILSIQGRARNIERSLRRFKISIDLSQQHISSLAGLFGHDEKKAETEIHRFLEAYENSLGAFFKSNDLHKWLRDGEKKSNLEGEAGHLSIQILNEHEPCAAYPLSLDVFFMGSWFWAAFSMLMGTCFLLISVTLEAVATQWKRVWVACIFIFAFNTLGFFYNRTPALVLVVGLARHFSRTKPAEEQPGGA